MPIRKPKKPLLSQPTCVRMMIVIKARIERRITRFMVCRDANALLKSLLKTLLNTGHKKFVRFNKEFWSLSDSTATP